MQDFFISLCGTDESASGIFEVNLRKEEEIEAFWYTSSDLSVGLELQTE